MLANGSSGANGNIFLGGNPQDGASGLRLYSASQAGAFIDVKTTNSNQGLYFRVDNGYGTNPRMTILPNGNVGVGTTAPSANFQVSNNLNSTKVIIGNGNTANDGKTSLVLATSQDANGFADIQSLGAAGSSFGSLCLNYRGGNVGIGKTSPSNKLEISGYGISSINTPNSNNPSNISGLRLTDLDKNNRNKTIADNSLGNVLSVNDDGDVIMVKPYEFGRDCGSNSKSADLLVNRELPMNNFNFIFRDGDKNNQIGSQNSLGIGEFQDCNLAAKLHVNRIYNALNEGVGQSRIGILSNVSDGNGNATNGPTRGYTSHAFRGVNDGFNDAMNVGIELSVRNSLSNRGAIIRVDDPNQISRRGFSNFIGVDVSVSGANGIGNQLPGAAPQVANIGVKSYATADNANVSSDYGVLANVVNESTGDFSIFGIGKVGNTSGIFGPSDKKLKKNIVPLENAMSIMEKIAIKTFEFDYNKYSSLNLPKHKTNYGVIAQELEEILPSLISKATIPSLDGKSSETIKLVNYTELIPITIAAIKELNTKVEKQNNTVIENDALKAKITDLEAKLAIYDEKFALLEKSIAQICESGCAGLEKKAEEGDVLYQSIPNPTDDVAVINYYLAKDYQTASIQLYTAEGKMVKDIKISATKGNGSTKVSLADLSNGIFHYSLIVDEKLVGSKNLQVLQLK